MAFCTNCGNAVGDRDAFCGACGSRQPGAGAASAAPGAAPGGPARPFDASDSIPRDWAPALCYAPWIGWIVAIIVLASEGYRREARIRFHAFQGLYLWVAYLIAEWVLKPMLWMGPFRGFNPAKAMMLAIVVTAIYMLVKTRQGETIRLPLIGDLAEKSVAEQG